uniref:Uncharacterized protein n=1 Tax=Ditylenchus dipsaci TaxID=166011 RepID=A0A915DMW3_9BILA
MISLYDSYAHRRNNVGSTHEVATYSAVTKAAAERHQKSKEAECNHEKSPKLNGEAKNLHLSIVEVSHFSQRKFSQEKISATAREGR